MIECFFDVSSPWTYLAFHNLLPMAAELKEEIRWRPILVGGVFNSVNPNVYESRTRPVPAKQNYLKKDLGDWARQAGLKILFPPAVFPVNSVKAMRGCLWLLPQNRMVEFARAVFEAYWAEDQDISQDAVLRSICLRLDIDPEAFFEGIAQPAVKDQLRINTEELIARGGFGSPTFFVGGGDLYFGNDRLGLVREAVLRQRSAPPSV